MGKHSDNGQTINVVAFPLSQRKSKKRKRETNYRKTQKIPANNEPKIPANNKPKIPANNKPKIPHAIPIPVHKVDVLQENRGISHGDAFLSYMGPTLKQGGKRKTFKRKKRHYSRKNFTR